MNTALNPYPATKPSGLPWLGDVPEHWEVRRSKWVFEPIDIRSETGEEELLTVSSDDGVIPRSSREVTMFQAESYVGHKLCWPGDLVINSLWAWANGLGFSRYHGIVSTAYGVYRPYSEYRPVWRYLDLALRSGVYQWEFQVRSKGIWTSRLQLTDSSFLDMPVLLPPLPEQRAIVRFLDHAGGKIRRFIRAKERLIELLEEQKQALIHEAVTGRIDVRTGKPYPAYKDSGVEWLGEVPEGWEVRRVKHVSRILRGKFTHRPRNDPSLYDGPYPFIQTGEVARAGKAITGYRQTLNERGLAVSKIFPAGTLVMTIAANIGEVAVLDFEACFPDSIVGFVPRSAIERDFLYYVFQAMKPELLREAPVNTQGNLNVERIGSRGIPLPAVPEQQMIVNYIETNTHDLSAATDRSRHEISLLHEYRTRLIADVVTGKLDVRGVAESLPSEAEVGLSEKPEEQRSLDGDGVVSEKRDIALTEQA